MEYGVRLCDAAYQAVSQIEGHFGWLAQTSGISSEDWQECQSWWESIEKMFGKKETLSANKVRRIISTLRKRDWMFREGDCFWEADFNLALRLESELIAANRAVDSDSEP